jgi:hypothetical protein
MAIAAACGDDPTQLLPGAPRRISAIRRPPGSVPPPEVDPSDPTGGGNPGDPGAPSEPGGGTPSSPTNPTTPTTPNPGAAGPALTCTDEINRYRATLGLAPLARWTTQEVCSDGEAQSDSQTGQAHGAFGRCTEMAQNECPGWPGAPDAMIKDCLKMMWAEGPGGGHYENMRGRYTKVACGFYKTARGEIWAVQNFR